MKKLFIILFVTIALFSIMGFGAFDDNDVSSLNKKITDLEYDVSNLESDVSKLKKNQSDLEEKISYLEGEITNMKN